MIPINQIHHQGSDNQGTLIVDATCAPSQIKYPRDMELLNEGREKLKKIIDHLHDPKTDGKKPRTYRHRARKQYLNIARCKKQCLQAAKGNTAAIAIHSSG